MKKLIRVIKNPRLILLYIIHTKYFRFLSDETFIKLEYYLKIGKRLNLKNPLTFNEKLNWLKLNNKNELYTKLVDKFEVRKYIEDKIGSEYLIPLIGVYNNFDEIDFSILPQEFVLKPTHTSGNVFICKDKSQLNIPELKAITDKWLERDYFYEHREWPYKHVKPRLIIEKYMVDESGTQLKDYKFFCSDGNTSAMFVGRDRLVETKFNFYDTSFNKLPVKQHYNNFTEEMGKPKSFDKMMELANYLSQEMPHVRVDFYDINGSIYFGEFTFFHFAGLERFEPEKWDRIFGDDIDLTLVK